MRKFALLLLLVGLFIQFSYDDVDASFGVSPADFTFENLRPGSSVQETFLLSRTDLENDANILVESDINGANDWVSVDPGTSFTIPAGQRTREMTVSVAVPEDAPLREYEGYLLVKVTEGEQTSGVSVVQGVGIAVNLITTRLEVTRLLIRSLEIPVFAQDELLRLILRTENQGNRAAAPERVEIIVYDLAGNELFRSEYNELESVNVGELKELIAEFDPDLEPGEYQADIVVIFQGEPLREDRLVFEVTEQKVEKVDEQPASRLADVNFLITLGLVFVLLLIAFILVFIFYKRRKERGD